MAQERGGLLPHRYQQVADDLRARISSGQYPAGDRLPTKPALMERYGVALGTLDKAIEELRKAGLVETRQGSGMFVRTPPPDSSEYDDLREQVAALQKEVAELRERVGHLEATLDTLTGTPRGGRREQQPKATASSGRR